MRKGLGYHNRRSPFGFNPGTLFAGGAAGAWYDPSDASTLFSDTAGTTPSPTPGGGALSVVGLMLDKSQGLVLGSERVGATWLGLDATWSQSGSTLTAVLGSSFTIYQPISPANFFYRVTFEIFDYVAGTLNIRLGNAGAVSANFNANGTYTVTASASGDGNFYWMGNSTFTGKIRNISVKQLPGNHAISYNTTTARPELSARVNLLTYSEQFDNAAWTKTAATVTANAAIAPDGTLTADFLAETAATGTHQVVSNINTISGVTYVSSFYAKANGRDWVAFYTSSASGGTGRLAYFYLVGDGVVGIVQSPLTASIQSVGSGWYRCSVTFTTNTVGELSQIIIASANGVVSYAGDITKGVYIWGADARPTNIGTSVPAYQRIADQYTYDSSGFPRYLVFNGTASGMYTPANLNLSGTDKATVFAGVRKLSDAAAGVVTELSATAFTNNGAFAMSAPGGALNSFFFRSRGTSVSDSEATFAAPTSRVVTGIGDIGADTNILRVNGTQAATSSADQGTGNYGSYALNIGVRSAAATPSLYFNGYIYSLIVVGSSLSAAQITSTESWINGKEGGVY